MAGSGTVGRGVRLSQREAGGLRGRRRDRFPGRAGAGRGRAGDDRDRRPRRVPADRRGGARAGDGHGQGHHGDQALRPPGGDRSLWPGARADPRLLRPEGRHLRQHPGHSRHRREDRQRADPALRLLGGGALARARHRRSQAQAEPDRPRRGRPSVQASGDRQSRPAGRFRPQERGLARARPFASARGVSPLGAARPFAPPGRGARRG